MKQRIHLGDIISDGLVTGKVIEIGEMRMGCGQIAAYRITILTGHEAGRESLIPAIYAKRVKK